MSYSYLVGEQDGRLVEREKIPIDSRADGPRIAVKETEHPDAERSAKVLEQWRGFGLTDSIGAILVHRGLPIVWLLAAS